VISASGDATTNATPEAPLSKSLSGTSMAAPTIAGNAALMRQFFTDGFYPRGSKTAADTLNPSGMVMKAVLLNSTNPFIDTNFGGNDFGWGRAYLDSNLWFASTLTGGNDTRRLRLFERTNATGLQTGEVTEYTISNVQAGQELRATLTWYDVEGALGAALSLVNNLDLEVVDPSSAVFKGNVFTAGVSTTGGTADSKNTVEQVRIKVPAAGSYTFRVKAINIPGNGRINTARQGYGLAVSAAFALPDPTPFPAPTISGIAEDNFAGIKVAFSATAGAQGFQLYRANGTCAMAVPGDFRLVATGAASPLNDDRSQGGYTYAYKVRGIQNDVEGAASNCVDVVSNDSCTLQPAFSEASIQRDQQNATCGIGLNWSPASALCPAASGITYTVYRDTNPYLTGAVILASGVTGTSITDTAITSGQPYYYGIKATDGVGNQSFRTRTINATALGPDGADGTTFLDDVDTHSYMELQGDWRITNTAASAGTFSYHNAGDGQTYNSNNCSTMITPPILVQSGASLSFKARYDMEFQWDGIVMEISTDGGTIWNDLPPTGGYPSTFAQTGSPPGNVCGYAASHGAFNGVTTATSNADPGNGTAVAVFKPFSANLASFAGQTVKIRWRFSSDSGAEFNGAYIDEISLGGTITDRIFSDAFESSASLICH
jgi:Subtilase family